MLFTCPHCGFTREVDPAHLPPGRVRVTCPRCRESFPWVGSEGTEPTVQPPSPLPVMAGFWIRTLAVAIDLSLLALIEAVLVPLLFRLGGLDPARSGWEGLTAFGIGGLFGIVVGWAYRVWFIGSCGQTPGKMAVRIKVVRREGGEVGYGRALLREVLGKFLSKVILGIGYLMIAFDPRKQGLHDKIADTYVIKL